MLYPIEPHGQVGGILLEPMRVFQIITAVILIAIPATGYALNDIDEYEYRSAITLLEDHGIIDGYEDGSFRPFKPINRAEFLKLVMLSVYGGQVQSSGNNKCFTDFIGEERWYWTYACAAKQVGIVHGNPDGTFRGENTVNLAEALKMSFEAWNVALGPDDATRPWYERYMNEAAPREVFRRFPFTPSYLLTRGEMAQLLIQLGEPIAMVNGGSSNSDSSTTLVPVIFPPKAAYCGNGVREGAEQCDDGNTEDGDGCSRICILVVEPIRHGAMRIEQQSVSNNSRASGTDDIPLFAFTAIAGRQDVYLTTLKLKSAAGSLGYAENYRLIIDNDGDGIVETLYGRARPSGEFITFGNVNILVEDGVYKRVELWADISNTFSMSSIAIAFDTQSTDFVEGVDKIDGEELSGIILDDGQCLQNDICWITVQTQPDQTVSIQAQGNLYVMKDSSPIGERQVVASTVTDTLLRLNFRADSEDIAVKELAIDGVSQSVEHLEFFIEGAAQPFAFGRKVSCGTVVSGRFCMDNDILIPQGGEKMIAIKAALKADTEGAVSGEQFTLAVSALTDATMAIEAEGYYSGQRLLQNDSDSNAEGEIFIGRNSAGVNTAIASEEHEVVFAKIASVTNANADINNTPIPTGSLTFAEFTFTAAPHQNTSGGSNSVEIEKIEAIVSAVNMQFDSTSFYIYNTENSATVSLCTSTGETGTLTVTCDGLDASAVSTYISQDDSINLAMRAAILSAQISPGVSILQASLNPLSNPSLTGVIEWTDGEISRGWVDIGITSVKSTSYRLD